jgi:poly(A) polymerase
VKPETYPYSQHLIPIERIDSDALYVIATLQHHGYESYLVGGSIRDLLLGINPKDFDVSTSAKPEEIKKIFPSCLLIGKRFRLAHVRFGKKVIEVSTFRSGDNQEDNLITQDNTWGTAEQDALRRDFRINGLFYDPTHQTVIDYVGGFEDIQRKMLQAIGEPYVRFRQDPVRMIRLLKFQARFRLNVDEKTELALLDTRHEILKSSQARIFEELLKMLESGSSYAFIQLMAKTGILEPLLPNLSHFLEHDATKSVFMYLKEIDALFGQYPELSVERSLLLACLIFPMVETEVKKNYALDPKKFHFGMIQQKAIDLVDYAFHPFFHVPRKLKSIIASIITTQFRLTPLSGARPKHFRLPPLENQLVSFKFFNLRSRIFPELKPLWSEWKKVADTIKPEVKPKSKPRRRFRRR